MVDEIDPVEGEDERIELDLEDDETSGDPTGEEDTEGTESEDAEGADGAVAAQPERVERQPSRAERRIQALDNRAKELAEHNARLTREMDELRRRMPAPVQEDPRVEAERLALMSPEDRIQYTVDRALRRQEQQTQAIVANMQQQADKTAFDARCATDTLRKKLASEVEREYAAVISRGQYLPRETIYIHLLGMRAEAARAKGKPQAEQNRRRNAAPPARGRGDETVDRRGRRANTVEEFERRNADILI